MKTSAKFCSAAAWRTGEATIQFSAGDQRYTITELAREFDITARAIRFYEDQGLLSPMREGAGRPQPRLHAARPHAPETDLRGKRLGLTLSEIKSIIDMYESPKDTSAQMHRFLGVLAHQRETLEQQRADIEMSLAEITAHEDECRRCWRKPAPANVHKK
jgi:DNA-binding transcriptional MerR regulator